MQTVWNTAFYDPTYKPPKVPAKRGRPDTIDVADVIRAVRLGAHTADAICAEVGFGKDSVRRHLYRLRDSGLITAKRKAGSVTIWRLSK